LGLRHGRLLLNLRLSLRNYSLQLLLLSSDLLRHHRLLAGLGGLLLIQTHV
jgi:hypothetical protein